MKNLQEIKLYLKRSRPDKDNFVEATKETHICTCEGSLSYKGNDEFLADAPREQEEEEDVEVIEADVAEQETQTEGSRR